jgi:hypothetical protein
MQKTRSLAIALVLIGVVALAYQGITYTTREKTLDLGPVQVTREKTRNIPLPPILGALALTGGIGLLIAARKP